MPSAFVLLSYPLLEPAPPPAKQKAGAIPPADSGARLQRARWMLSSSSSSRACADRAGNHHTNTLC